MSVNRISQSHAHEAQAVQNVNSQTSQNATTKADAVDGQNPPQGHTETAAQTKPTATGDNSSAAAQARKQNTGSETNGTRVNVYA